jgi:hypothetical protein
VTVAHAVAAFLAWGGASVIVLADGRRGVAAGLALTTAALAFLAWSTGGAVAAAALAAGGGLAAFKRDRTGHGGWAVMPEGSTPRLILCVAAGLLAFWIAASVMTGPGASVRFAVLSVVGLMGGRVLSSRDPSVLLAAVAVLALALALAAGVSASEPEPVPYFAGALVSAGVMFVRLPAPHAA